MADEDSAGDGIRAALELFETTLTMLELRLRREHPDATGDEIEALVGLWLDNRPGAERGDAEGVPVSLPRPA